MDRSRREGEPPEVGDLAAEVAGGAASAVRRDLAPIADEVRREEREVASQAGALGGACVLGLFAL